MFISMLHTVAVGAVLWFVCHLLLSMAQYGKSIGGRGEWVCEAMCCGQLHHTFMLSVCTVGLKPFCGYFNHVICTLLLFCFQCFPEYVNDRIVVPG